MTKTYDREMEERELDAALKEALAKGDHKTADTLLEQYEPPKTVPGEIL